MAHTEPIPGASADRQGILRETAGNSVSAVSLHPYFMAAWYGVNFLLIIAVLAAAYSVAWEYSTRIYLKGFSDAIIPASSSPETKIEAILNWMAEGPTRRQTPFLVYNRDPIDTLNYASLLRVCGTATNAFINLADSGGLSARRLLLIDSQRAARHVVAEVLVGGRWIVVDPTYRTILRGADGQPLTREELADPAVLTAATQKIPGYDPSYTYDHTSHVHLSRLSIIGPPLRRLLNRLLPGWDNSTTVSLVLERESLAAVVLSLISVLLLGLSRMALRVYGERRLGFRHKRFLRSIERACHAFLDASG